MKRLFTIGIILATLAMIGYGVWRQMREKSSWQETFDRTSDGANIKRTIRVLGDDWLGYMVLRSPEFGRALAAEGIRAKFEMEPDFGKRLAALRDGSAEFAAITLDSYLVNGAAHEWPGVAIFVIDESYGGDAVVARGGLENLDALNRPNLRGAFAGNSPSEFLLRAEVTHFRLAALKPRLDRMRVDTVEAAYKQLADGKVDFAVLWEPFVSRALAEIPQTKVLIDTKHAQGLVVDLALASRKVIAAEPALAATFTRAYFLALHSLLNQPARLQEVAARDTGKKADVASTMLAGIRFHSLEENATLWLNNAGREEPRLATTVGSIQRILADHGKPVALPNDDALALLYRATVQGVAADRASIPALTAPRPPGGALYRPLTDAEWKALVPRVRGTLIDEAITFRPGSTEVPENFQELLRDAVPKLLHYPSSRLVVEAHVAPSPSTEDDQRLSDERALAVKRFLMWECGVPDERILALGLGGTQPPRREAGEGDSAWERRARRARVLLVGD